MKTAYMKYLLALLLFGSNGSLSNLDYIKELLTEEDTILNKFSDLKQSHWSYPDVMEAANDHTGVKIKDGEAWVKQKFSDNFLQKFKYPFII